MIIPKRNLRRVLHPGVAQPPGSIYLVLSKVEIIRDGKVDLVYNPVPGPLGHPAGATKELPGCILGEKTFLSRTT